MTQEHSGLSSGYEIPEEATPISRLVAHYVKGGICSAEEFQNLVGQLHLEEDEVALEQWQDFLALLFLHKRVWPNAPFPEKLQKHLKRLTQEAAKTGNQLLESYAAFARLLITQVNVPVDLEQTPSGMAPQVRPLQTKVSALPSPFLHAQQGVLWLLMGALTKEEKWVEAAQQLAQWQLNTLDKEGKPYRSLFSNQVDTPFSEVLIWNYLLYHTLALTSQSQEWSKLAMQQLPHLSKRSIEGLPLLIEHWFREHFQMPEASTFHLDEDVCDYQLPIVGHRSDEITVICTLAGNQTGLGILDAGDVSIVNYGPHQIPLTNSQAFGIQSPMKNYSHRNAPKIEKGDNHFSLSRCVRCAPETGPARLEIKQNWKNNLLKIEIEPLNPDQIKKLAFVYYIRADYCHVQGGEEVVKHSLNRYAGSLEKITFTGKNHHLTLATEGKVKKMEIIPLAGGDDFWGADFLVAYEVGSSSLSWTAKLSSIVL